MCGIIGINSNKPVTGVILNSLKKLEYRGYDSAGVATLNEGMINETKYIGRNAKMDGLTSFNIFSSPVKRNFSLSESLFETASAGASVSVLTAVSSVVSDVTSSSDMFTSPNYYPYIDGHEPCGDFINEVVPMSVLHCLGYYPNPYEFLLPVHHQFLIL